MGSNHYQFQVSQIDPIITSVKDHYYQLILVVGKTWRDRTSFLKILADYEDFYYISLGLPLSKAMLEKAPKVRPLVVQYYVSTLLRTQSKEGYILDHLEILFSPSLLTDPLRLLQSISRSRIIVASWPGVYDGDRLMYASPGDDEYFSTKIDDLQTYSIEV